MDSYNEQYAIIRPYLDRMVQEGASDIFMTEGSPPSLRIENHVRQMNAPALSADDIDALLEDSLTDDQLREFDTTLELNSAIELDNGERFRLSVFRQRTRAAIVARHIKSQIPTIEQLRLPEIYRDLVMRQRGLVLLVGATGSGKSTSLAAMVDYRNSVSHDHIITVEDPIEYYHQHKKCLISQREVGIDTYSYGIALKNALRQSPDVMMIGEIRDLDALENAMLFCETGHLVLSTLHANNSNQAIERIMNFFPEEMQQQAMITLSQNLNAIISQRLVEGTTGHRELAYEILLNDGLVTQLIEDLKIKEIKEVMEKNVDQGMITFDQCLQRLVEEGRITEKVALREADNPSNLRLRLTQSATEKEFSSGLLSGDISDHF